jgi:hypothetical protein
MPARPRPAPRRPGTLAARITSGTTETSSRTPTGRSPTSSTSTRRPSYKHAAARVVLVGFLVLPNIIPSDRSGRLSTIDCTHTPTSGSRGPFPSLLSLSLSLTVLERMYTYLWIGSPSPRNPLVSLSPSFPRPRAIQAGPITLVVRLSWRRPGEFERAISTSLPLLRSSSLG